MRGNGLTSIAQPEFSPLWMVRSIWLASVLAGALALREGSLLGVLLPFAFLIGLAQYASP